MLYEGIEASTDAGHLAVEEEGEKPHMPMQEVVYYHGSSDI
jgi:hypothetical protein